MQNNVITWVWSIYGGEKGWIGWRAIIDLDHISGQSLEYYKLTKEHCKEISGRGGKTDRYRYIKTWWWIFWQARIICQHLAHSGNYQVNCWKLKLCLFNLSRVWLLFWQSWHVEPAPQRLMLFWLEYFLMLKGSCFQSNLHVSPQRKGHHRRISMNPISQCLKTDNTIILPNGIIFPITKKSQIKPK